MLRLSWPLRVCAMLVVLSAPAYAQKGSTKEAERAREFYDAGRKAYNLGDFDLAIESWKQGYNLKDDPVFLYNIAQAYRQKEDLPKALFFYKSYLREARDAPLRAEVEQRILEIQQALDAQKAAATAPPSGAATTPGGEEKARPADETPPETTSTGEVPAVPPPPVARPTDTAPKPAPRGVAIVLTPAPVAETAPRRGRSLRIAGFVSAGLGVALVATGVLFANKATETAADIEAASKRGEAWTPALEDKDQGGRNQAQISQVTLGLGVAALLGGGVLSFLGWSQDQARPAVLARVQVTPVLARTAATLAMTWEY